MTPTGLTRKLMEQFEIEYEILLTSCGIYKDEVKDKDKALDSGTKCLDILSRIGIHDTRNGRILSKSRKW
jgi:hypothetical protein